MANRRGKGESSDRSPLLGLKNHCGWWPQPWNQKMIVSWQESYDKLRQCVKKQRHHFANKGPCSQGYDLSVFTHSCESWTIKKAEHWRIDALEQWCWRRLLRVPWTTRRSNPSLLKEINLEYSLEVLILKLKLQYVGQLMQTGNSLAMTLMLGKIEGGRKEDGRGWDSWMASLMQWAWTWWTLGDGEVTEAWCAAVPGVTKSWTWLGDRTTCCLRL